MNIAIYARFSNDNQREKSIDAQVRAAEEYAKRNGDQVVKIYVDRAKTVTSDQRQEFQQMIQDSASGIFQAVIVHTLDCFSHNCYDAAYYKRILRMNGVKLFSVLKNIDNSSQSIIIECVLEGLMEYYSTKLSREAVKELNGITF
jgi:site-specific DNA recombinase